MMLTNMLGVTIILLLAAHFKPVFSVCSAVCPPVEDSWRSNVTVDSSGPRHTVVVWDADTVVSSSMYVVLYRQRLGSPSFMQSSQTTELRYNITGLSPMSAYEVQVCRVQLQSTSDDCGSCLLCFATTAAQEPPEPPSNVRVRVSNPEVLTVLWDPIGNVQVDMYHVLCVDSTTGAVALNSSQAPSVDSQVTGLDFSPDTTYNCSVAASNEFGFGAYSTTVQGNTPPRTTAPGVLLMAFGDRVDYTQLTESTVLVQGTYTDRLTLFSTPSTVRGLDYHFYRKEIYFTTADKTIRRVNFTQTEESSDIILTTQGDPETIISLSDVDSLGPLAVDWVYHELYWVEFDDTRTGSRIMRGVLSDGNLLGPYCVVDFSTDVIRQIRVDPVHGYFYWNDVSGLHRASLDSVRVDTLKSSCTSNIQDRETLINTEVVTFTIESDEIYLIRRDDCFVDFTFPTNYSLSVAHLNGENIVSYSPSANTVKSIASFTQVIITPASNLVIAARVTVPASCPMVGATGAQADVQENIELLRSYRSVQQPQPAPTFPVSDVRVISTANSASITWSAPLFIGFLFSAGAFDDWEYDVMYSPVGSDGSPLEVTTTSLNMTLINLMSGTIYELDIIARGLGGVQSLTETLLFTTKAAASADALLLIATQTGLLRSNFDGSSIECVGGTMSEGSNGVAYDSYSDIFFWTIDGSLGKVIGSQSTMESDAQDLYDRLTNPFSLKLDWVTRRLFWVQDGNLGHGSHNIMSATVVGDLTPEAAQVFEASVDSIETTAIDSLNGYLFWVNDKTINWRSLSGLELATCYLAPQSPTALTVDPDRQRLYWLSNAVMDNGPLTLTINQLEYNNTECANSITAKELPDIQFSSSATVLAYASDTLFIASQRSSVMYTIPSRIETLSAGQQFAVSTVELSSVCKQDTPVLSIKDVTVISTSSQPLPVGLDGPQRGLVAVTPQSVLSPPTLGSGSTSVIIDIQWIPPPPLPRLPEIVFLYMVEYYLAPSSSSVVTNGSDVVILNRLTLLNQQPSTTVTSRVTACSPWQCSMPSQSATFVSPPDFPGQVINVRAYVYRPLASGGSVTALVVWDSPPNSIVDVYTITVSRDGQEIQDIYQPTSNQTYHTILARNFENFVTYPLAVSATTYAIQVTARNPTGSGPPSNTVAVTDTSPNYPQQVLAISSSDIGQVVGMESGQGAPLSIPFSSPVVVDTIERQVYYYNSAVRTLFRSPLDGSPTVGPVDPLLFIDASLDILDLAYDWLSQEVYYAVRNSVAGSLEIYRVFVKNRDRNVKLFPALMHSITSSAYLELTMDPFKGFLYWLESDGSVTRLYSIDLRDINATSSTLLSSTSRRRRQVGGTESLINLNLSPALSLDPVSGELIVCSAVSGDIFTCDVTTGTCTRTVDAGVLNGGVSNGLPTTSITLDENHIYWIGGDIGGVFAIERSNPSILINISNVNVSSVVGLSPGLQPLASQGCSAPKNLPVGIRPRARVTSVGSTFISLEWDAPQLPINCASEVFGFPSLTYGVFIHIGTPIGENIQETFDTQFTAMDLLPFTNYQVQLRATNVFSFAVNADDLLLGTDVVTMTTEGEPDPPFNIVATTFGTASVQLQWESGELRGYVNNLIYYIISTNIEVSSRSSKINVTNDDGLALGTSVEFQIKTSNGVFNSSAAVVPVILWPLAPAPEVVESSITSLVVRVPLTSQHTDIEMIALQWCEVSGSAIGVCVCLNGNTTNFQTVPSLPTNNILFNIANLLAFTKYCLLGVAKYRTEPGFTSETTNGNSNIARTNPGVPDAPPMVSITNGIIRWTMPNSRGDNITIYRITGMVIDGEGPDILPILVQSNSLTYDLSTEEKFDVSQQYSVQVIAVNGIGDSMPSMAVTFQREATSALSVGAIAGVAVGGVLFIALFVGVLFCFVFCCKLSRSKNQELRSLSYMYGPDHELSNLRSAYRQTQSSNPHYTWSREDYVCTDEDLDLLSKFPRHNLKLENFIDRGEFGEVYQGTAMDIFGPETGPTPVAVKTLRKGATVEEQRKFLSEASLMSNFNHPNIVKVLGVCLDNDPVYIIMELMPAGDLLKFLREAKRDHGPALLTLVELIQVILDVAQGCRYLEQQHFIHRDIAARNCLVSSKGADRVVKIGDFGLAKDLYSSDYYQVEGQRKLPVRWMAPEALLQGKFTVESDIWSFGILLWEIMTLGNQPYPGRINQEVLQFVTGGGRLDKPDKCPTKIYHLMQNCWKRYASERPHFELIVTILTTFLDRIKRPDSVYYSDSESDTEADSNLRRQSSGKTPTRTPSIRSGIMNLARTGSMKFRNSFRRHGSVHKRDDHNVSQLPEGSNSFRERGPF